MKITFLGTGAADFLPSLSDKNRYTLSKDIRRCTVTLLDENTLIDCGPHILDEIEIHHIDPTLIENILWGRWCLAFNGHLLLYEKQAIRCDDYGCYGW